MSTNGTQKRVKDDEGDVDKQTKQQILTLRKQVDDDERALYIEGMSSPDSNLSIPEANQYWGVSVRQYLRGIKRLWTDADQTSIRNVTQYWEELPIGTERLVPPDREGYQFSLLDQHKDYSDSALRRQLDLPRNAELPRPINKQFKGLRSVLKTNRIEHTWLVKVEATGPPPEHEHVRLEVMRPVPKHILENAVEAADSFLQQAGLGFEVAVPDYYGGDEPGL